MSLQGKRIAIPTEEMYHVLELWYPYYRLKEEGAEPVIVGTGTAPIHYSKDHYPVTPHTTADKVTADEFDGMVVPGGYAPDLMRRHPAMLKLVKDIFDQGKVMAAICHAGWLLVSAGVLKGRKATCFFAIKDDMINAGAQYVDQEVVVDGNLITSRMPDDLPVFMKTVIKALA